PTRRRAPPAGPRAGAAPGAVPTRWQAAPTRPGAGAARFWAWSSNPRTSPPLGSWATVLCGPGPVLPGAGPRVRGDRKGRLSIHFDDGREGGTASGAQAAAAQGSADAHGRGGHDPGPG